jgi:beta-phosphoglucomutase family hydrolase
MMSFNPTNARVNLGQYKAVLFDLDGVLTDTAKVHAACWKKLFDKYLEHKFGPDFEPFTNADYLDYVDGKMRYEGVKSFLESRQIQLPYGYPANEPGYETICALGNQKDALFNEVLETDGVKVYEGSIAWVRKVLEQGLLTAVVSSSQHCRKVLKAAQIDQLFATVVDGNTIEQLKLNGKPAPDGFLKASQKLGVKPETAIVVEDAISGVQAGKAGEFALVIGVDRQGKPDILIEQGADLVVADLGELIYA